MKTTAEYIPSATAEIELFYKRSQMSPGDSIKGFEVNKQLIQGLNTCDTVIFSMFWKPIGDSLLFVSIIKACYEYLKLTRSDNMPNFLLDAKFSNLVKHISFLKDVETIPEAVTWYKRLPDRTKYVLITDDDIFEKDENTFVFNSEEYQYPKFFEINSDGVKVEYSSRPARYFLTFEREVGTVLQSDPNTAIPDFITEKNETLRNAAIEKYGFDPDDESTKYIGVVSQASMVEKKFGSMRFMEVAKELAKDFSDSKIIFLANPKEESSEEWWQLLKEFNENAILIDSEDFELLSYIFARCHFVFGNDTGFTHLAAMSKKDLNSSNTLVFSTYSRHDYKKWSTGKSNVHAIATELAEYLMQNNMSIGRDKIDVKKEWGFKEWALSISEERLTNTIRDYFKKNGN